MKTIPSNRVVPMALLLATLAVSAASAHAADRSNQRDSSRVIHLHAPNHTTRTLVVWTRKAPVKPSSEVAARAAVQTRSVGLPAGNGPVQSLTVWTERASDAYEVAPLK